MNELVYIGSKRTVFALDCQSGQEMWRTRLPRLWGSQVTLLVDGDALYVARGAYVYRLDRWSGEILWEQAIGESPTYVAMLATAGAASGGHGAVGASAAAAQSAAVMAAAGGAAAAGAAASG